MSAAPAQRAQAPLLQVRDLTISVRGAEGTATAVAGVSFDLEAGEAMGLVGESGSGKSLTLRAILGLLPPGARIVRGNVLLDGVELVGAGARTLRRIRGSRVSMVFQEPMTALNPVVRVGRQIVDGAAARRGWSRREAQEQALRLAREMGIADAEAVLSLYPHELSGGLRQRVMIAAALANQPRLLLCDEPTTALDVTIQDQIVKLLARLRDELSMSLLYVTHDLAVVAQLCGRVQVMYAGSILESGPTQDVFRSPSHPYTLGLIEATPDVEGDAQTRAIPGSAPSVFARPTGCPFHPRCPVATADCSQAEVSLTAPQGNPRHLSACVHPERVERPRQSVKAS
ncbi:MAG TPA: ABC transporter ATP-binding protein [Solirubrobacteraceae bacterium]|nr:ABC transporter ATP-binding protein [Solirubrobacteraceae bacterium]